MRWGRRARLQAVKLWAFEFFYTLDTTQFTNRYARLVGLVMELSVLHYFYINPLFSFLTTHALFANYFQGARHYFVHTYAFAEPLLALLTLSLYPTIAILACLIKKFGPNKVLLPVVQMGVFLWPLLWVKVAIEAVSGLASGQWPYLMAPLAVINLLFGGALLVLLGRPFRILEFPLVLLLQLRGNMYFTLTVLAGRLLVLGCLLRRAHFHSVCFYFEAALMAILVAAPFCGDHLLNSLAFAAVLAACLATGSNETRRALVGELSILDFAELLQEQDEEEAAFEVWRRVQAHHAECDLPECLCQEFYGVNRAQLGGWTLRFEQERLRRLQKFEGRLEYAERCWSHYDYRLSGLVRVCEGKPRGLLQEYQVFRACAVYEHNLRKQDKNYRHGEPYRNAQEDLQIFHQHLTAILADIRKFWSLITAFDGSTKFLSEILVISKGIARLRREYGGYASKYDEELKEFKYGYELFLSLVLNQEIPEEDEILLPDPAAFIVTNGLTILNANNAFCLLVSQNHDVLLDHPYTCFVPEVYRDVHRRWAAEFVERAEQYEGQTIAKCLSVGGLEIKLVEMQHRVLPRFLEGLEVFTSIRLPTKTDGFVFLAERETFYIKNVEAGFFEAIKFKVSQRSFKLLQEMSIFSIFEHFTTNLSENPGRETTIFPHFLEEFTFTKTKRKQSKVKPRASRASGLTGKIPNDNEQVFEYEILPNLRPEDPYVKVRFRLKDEKAQSVASSQQSMSRVEPEQGAAQEKTKKEEDYGFTIPYLLVGVLALSHLFYALGRVAYDSALLDVQNRYQFYIDYDYTALSVLGAQCGADRTAELRQLWIEGYGGFSESFNALRRVQDPLFMQYFRSKVAAEFHNALFLEINERVSAAGATLRGFQALTLAALLVGMGCYALDLVTALRYTFFIEGKVGALLLQFVIIDEREVAQILAMIQSFEAAILNCQEALPYRVPVEVGEDSAFELVKGGGYSLSNSVAEHEQETPKEEVGGTGSSGKRRGSSMVERERVSLSLMKEELRQTEKSRFKRESSASDERMEEKQRSISLFKRRYRSCTFILKANKRLFLLIAAGFLLSFALVALALPFLYVPFNDLPVHLQALHTLEQARIILLKSQTQILTAASPVLLPTTSLSNTLLTLIGLVSSVSSGDAMGGFAGRFGRVMNSDACDGSGFNCTLLKEDNNLHNYGIKVVSQYIENYFRQQEAAALAVDNLPNRLIAYSQFLFTQLAADLVNSSRQRCKASDAAELRMVVIGSLGLLAAMLLIHFSLRQFKDRIENSRSLLQIIPKEVRKRQEKEIEVLTLKDLSTP